MSTTNHIATSTSYPTGNTFGQISKLITVTYLSAVCILSLFGNLIILGIILKTPQLRNLTHLLVANLCVFDLLCSLLAVPMSIIGILAGEWIFGEPYCMINGYLHTFLCSGSTLTLSAISIERYFSIAHPLSYANHSTRSKICFIISYIWIQSAVVALPPLIGANSYVFKKHKGHCSFAWEQSLGHVIFIVTLGSLCFLLPAAVLLTMYCTVLRIARQTTRRVCPEVTEHGRVNSIVLTGDGSNQRRSQQRSADQTSNGDSKAIKIIFLLLSTFFLTWTPFFVLNIYGTAIPGEVDDLASWEVLATCLAFTSCAINPFLYGLLNRNVRQEILESIQRAKDKLCGNVQGESELEDNFGSEDFFQFLERTTTIKTTKHTDLEIIDFPGQSTIEM